MPTSLKNAPSREQPLNDPMKRMVLDRRLFSRRQLAAGVVGTLFLHLWIWMLFSLGVFSLEYEETEDPYREYSIELAAPEEPEAEQVYTQTNPDVPENEPDQTNRFAARSQQAANPEAPQELDPERRPATESEDLTDTDQFLEGSLQEPLLAPPPSEQQEQADASQPPAPNQPMLQAVDPSQQALRKEIPIMGSQEEADPDDSGIADYDYDQLDEAPTNVLDLIEGEEEEGEEETREEQPQVVASANPATPPAESAVPSPRPRPQLPRVPSGPVRNSRLGVSAVGQLAVDAKASKFGEYMERLIETVKLNWDDLVDRSSHIETNSTVKIKFILTRDGLVSDMEILEGTTSRAIGIYMCREAIQRGVPFGPWPPGVVEMFGDEEDITFTFNYF